MYSAMDEPILNSPYIAENGNVIFKVDAAQKRTKRSEISLSLESIQTELEVPSIKMKGCNILEIEGRTKNKKKFVRTLDDSTFQFRDVPLSKDSLGCFGKIGSSQCLVATFPDLCTVEMEFAVPASGSFLACRVSLRELQQDLDLDWIRFLEFEVEFPCSDDRAEKARQLLHYVLQRLLVIVLAGLIALICVMPQEKMVYLGIAGVAAIFLGITVFDGWFFSGPRCFLFTGWNAWSFTGTLMQGESVPSWRMPSILVEAFHAGTKCRKGPKGQKLHLASEMFGVLADRTARAGVVAGFLSQKLQFGAVGLDKAFRKVSFNCACDGVLVKQNSSISTDWAVVQLLPTLPDDPLEAYYNAVAKHNKVSELSHRSEVPVGWCSWYHFFNAVTEQDLLSNITHLENIKETVPLQLFQIDDGYQAAWGDWTTLDPKKFNLPMEKLVHKIKALNMTPGLWLAPFSADKDSEVAAMHPEWIIRKSEKGPPSNSGNCGKWFYGLDATNTEVQDHVKSFLKTVTKEWGFSYVKLDFLYSAVLIGAKKDMTLTRAQGMQLAYKTIREAIGEETFFLGCGTPLGSAVGWVDANRVSTDAGLSWFPEFPFPHSDKWNLPSARSMMQSTIVRMGMHGKWWINDPDCLLLREETKFSLPELISIATIKALSGGSLLLSDDLKTVSKERLAIAEKLLPPTNAAGTPLDLLDRHIPEDIRLSLNNCTGMWVLMAFCNWEAAAKEKICWVKYLKPLVEELSSLGDQDEVMVFMLNFWESSVSAKRLKSRELLDNFSGSSSVLDTFLTSQHASNLISFRLLTDSSKPMYLGSDIHFSCGFEVCKFTFTASGSDKASLVLQFDVKRTVGQGFVWIYIPSSELLGTLPVSGPALSPKVSPQNCGLTGVWKISVSLQNAPDINADNTLQIDWCLI